MIQAFLHDLKFAIRSFAKRPLFAGVIILTLGLGIASNVAIFSVANAVLFRALPFENPEQLAFVWTRQPKTNVARSLVSGPDLKDYGTETTRFQGFGAAVALAGTLTGEGTPERIVNAYVSWNTLDLLGVRPILGRTHREDDSFRINPQEFGQPNPNIPPNKVVLSHGLWLRRFGGDSSVIGKTIQMDGWGSVVIGVLPRDFRIYLPPDAGMPSNIDAWGILPNNLSEFQREAAFLTVFTRLKPGVTLEQAQGDMSRLAGVLRERHQFHKTQDLQIIVAGMHRDIVEHARPALLALLGAVSFVLLIACANIANLLLVRASERGREIAVRAALGSGRGRIVAQMLTESLTLGAGGLLLGLLLAWQGIRVIKALSPADLPRIESVSLDGRAFLFAALVTIVAALLFGLAPALRALRTNLSDALRDRGTDTGGAKKNKLRTALVIGEVTLSLVLLIGAGLMVRSFAAIQRVNPGFDANNVVTFTSPMPFVKYLTSQARATFYNQLSDRLAAMPGVEVVGGATPLPLAGGEQYSVGSYGKIGDAEDVYQSNKADFKAVIPGYFEALKIKLVAGRTFIRSDNEDAALDVAVVDEKFAAKVFGKENPIGAQIHVDHFNEKTFRIERVPITIVGVVGNARAASLAAEGRETVYVPYVFQAFLPVTFTVRTAAAPSSLLNRIREEVKALDPDVPVADLAPFQTFVTKAMAQTKFLLALSATFAGLALVLAALGLYGVISFSARQRTREIGVRIALGASNADVLKLILGQGLVLAVVGIALGLVASVVLTRVVSSYLVGVSARDLMTFVAVPLVLLAVSLIASYIPARRATAVDPVRALHDE
ncbi:MAG TPA: ABC transporter permease [Gemmatimonadaceae bacterium]|nr:ABC transporter permease [Gemmatimonadaceae bacterium]